MRASIQEASVVPRPGPAAGRSSIVRTKPATRARACALRPARDARSRRTRSALDEPPSSSARWACSGGSASTSSRSRSWSAMRAACARRGGELGRQPSRLGPGCTARIGCDGVERAREGRHVAVLDADEPRDLLEDLRLAARLAQPPVGAGLEDGVARVVEGAGRHGDDGHRPARRPRADRAHRGEAVHDRHVHVHQHDVRRPRVEHGERLDAVLRPRARRSRPARAACAARSGSPGGRRRCRTRGGAPPATSPTIRPGAAAGAWRDAAARRPRAGSRAGTRSPRRRGSRR